MRPNSFILWLSASVSLFGLTNSSPAQGYGQGTDVAQRPALISSGVAANVQTSPEPQSAAETPANYRQDSSGLPLPAASPAQWGEPVHNPSVNTLPPVNGDGVFRSVASRESLGASTEIVQKIEPSSRFVPAGGTNSALPLRRRTAAGDSSAERPKGGFLQMLMSVGTSLVLVIGLFLGVAWCYRRTGNPSLNGLPKHVVSVLGRSVLAPRQQLVLLRFGSKLVLVNVAQGDARTISEITDAVEVDRLAGLCESARPGSISESFRSVLLQTGKERS